MFFNVILLLLLLLLLASGVGEVVRGGLRRLRH